ncbi:hypothetical protein UPYG_G00266300 [Umbra pygmaea]|uniref:Serine/threonine-protein kinase WNK CCTL2 domain-containing protein n=1 Tax=Umbra pygmaea TaxID=75934 RepID=A0ABD0WAU9_UMBPY
MAAFMPHQTSQGGAYIPQPTGQILVSVPGSAQIPIQPESEAPEVDQYPLQTQTGNQIADQVQGSSFPPDALPNQQPQAPYSQPLPSIQTDQSQQSLDVSAAQPAPVVPGAPSTHPAPGLPQQVAPSFQAAPLQLQQLQLEGSTPPPTQSSAGPVLQPDTQQVQSWANEPSPLLSPPINAEHLYFLYHATNLSVLQASVSVSQQVAVEQTAGQAALGPHAVEGCLSDPASGLSDGCEGASGGRHEGRSMIKRHQRRSVRSRSHHEKTTKAKLNVLNISNMGDRVAECQLETHNRKMVTFKFDLDGDNPDEIADIMVSSDFILDSERDSFIEQVREVIDMADNKREVLKEGYAQPPFTQIVVDGLSQQPGMPTPLPGVLPSVAAQVVHSAGRRFIVSPVPESRLREQFFGPSSASTSFGDEAPPAGLGLSLSAPSGRLQQAFTEMRQTRGERRATMGHLAEMDPSTVPCSQAGLCPDSPPSHPHQTLAPPDTPVPSSSTISPVPILPSNASPLPPYTSPGATGRVSPTPVTTEQTPHLQPGCFHFLLPLYPPPALPRPLCPAAQPPAALPPASTSVPPVSEQQSPAHPGSTPSSQPVPASIPMIQAPTQLPPSTQPGEPDGGESQSKAPGIDDIHALDKKLRSLFKDTTSADPGNTGTTSPPMETISPPPGIALVPPSNLCLTSNPGQGLTSGGHAQTPSNTSVEATLAQASTPTAEQMPPFPGPSQPVASLDNHLKRAQSPETVPPSSAVLLPSTGVVTLGRFHVSVASDSGAGSTPDPPNVVSSSSLTSSSLSSPESTLHRSTSLSKGARGEDSVDGVSSVPAQPTTIGRFQVSTSAKPSPGSKVGRFSVTPSTAISTDPSSSSNFHQNGPSSSTNSDPRSSAVFGNSSSLRYVSSDNDDESGPEDKTFQREVSRLREKHLMEIQNLHSRQKEELEALFKRLGKAPPSAVLSPALTMPAVRRRPKTKASKSARSSGQPSPMHLGAPASSQSPKALPPKQMNPAMAGASEPGRQTPPKDVKSSFSMPCLNTSIMGLSGTSSDSGANPSHSQPSGSNVTPAVTQSRTGTFTDDLHQLVDNWARDAISLSQGKKGPKGPAQGLAHEPAVPVHIPPQVNMGRKFSAPGQLCPTLPTTTTSSSTLTGTHLSTTTNPSIPLCQRQGSLGPSQGFGYGPPPYNTAPQWTGATGPCQVGLLAPTQPLAQYQPQAPSSAPLQQAFHMGAAQKPVTNPGGPNLRPT